MQIRRIALYSRDGQIRPLDFKLGAVNIISGKSRTGKSAIIDIIDYCLGRSSFSLFEGVNRDTVAWYALVLQVNEGQVLLAKPAPQGAARSQSSVYIQAATEVEMPPLAELKPNSNDRAVVTYLSRLLGISPNRTEPGLERTTDAFEATIDHAKFYLFQEQSLVANRRLLFYRQDEQFIPQHIKDTMPYFLGAVQEERLQLVQRLRDARRRLTTARKRLNETNAIAGGRLTQAQSLLAEAREVGILNAKIAEEDVGEVHEALRDAAAWSPNTLTVEAEDTLYEATRQLQAAQAAFNQKYREIREAESSLRDAQGYTNEAGQQATRLQAIGLFTGDDGSGDHCPICSSRLEVPPPAVASIARSLARLEGSLRTVTREQPRLQEHIDRLREDLEVLRDTVRVAKERIDALVNEREEAARFRDANARAARVAGRISLYVENVRMSTQENVLGREVEQLEQQVRDLEQQLDPDDVEDMRRSILNVIAARMTESAKALQLEFAGNPYRLDDGRLTVVVDTPNLPIPMDRMGSGENWLGCHLIALLALHQHFVSRQRPVPNFLVLDQPSQVYFPSYESYRALEGQVSDLEGVGADVIAVQRMFDFLFDTVEQLSPNFQIIVTEHANINNERFQHALVEEPWHGGRALIPQEWFL